jgi:hypothetical protein
MSPAVALASGVFLDVELNVEHKSRKIKGTHDPGQQRQRGILEDMAVKYFPKKSQKPNKARYHLYQYGRHSCEPHKLLRSLHIGISASKQQ